MSANPATMEAFWESELLWWVLFRILSHLLKNSSSWGSRGEQILNRIHNNTLDSLKASMVTGFADIPREETTLLLMICFPYNTLFFLKPARGSSTVPTITLRTTCRS